MPSLKSIRKRISSVKSTQKITRAMKMVAGARLNRAQLRITELRPYAVKTQQVLSEVTYEERKEVAEAEETAELRGESTASKKVHPLLELRPERSVLLVVLTSDRGLCGGFNTGICKLAETEWHRREGEGQTVHMLVVGRKGRDYFRRRHAPMEHLPEVWSDLSWDGARKLARTILLHFVRPEKPVDAIYLVYNEFKSAMTQRLTSEVLLPVAEPTADEAAEHDDHNIEFLFEPSEDALLNQLVPMYVHVSVLRALYESMASELGARMTAMDAATKNASEMIEKLTLQYNRARQASITNELMEIIGGSEALKG